MKRVCYPFHYVLIDWGSLGDLGWGYETLSRSGSPARRLCGQDGRVPKTENLSARSITNAPYKTVKFFYTFRRTKSSHHNN
ncbi:MAG: hypothetical protein CTY16_19275 [Methylobacter sp.]|nr:MAG: hypothetical protein CTY16_19275 [Methylobacter sp.]